MMSAQAAIIIMALICYLVGFLSKKSDSIYYYCGVGAGFTIAALIVHLEVFK